MLTRANPKSNREEYKGEEQRLVNCKKMVKDSPEHWRVKLKDAR